MPSSGTSLMNWQQNSANCSIPTQDCCWPASRSYYHPRMDQTTFFSFRCPACAGRARVASHHAGQTIVCPYCQVNAIARPDIQPSVVPRAPSQQRVDAYGNPVTTSRVARPLEAPGTTSVRRVQASAGSISGTATSSQPFDTQELFADERPSLTSTRSAAPGMSGFADNRPGTASVRGASSSTATVTRAHVSGHAPRQEKGYASSQPSTATVSRGPRPGQVVQQSSTATISRPPPGRPAAAPTTSQAPFFVASAAAVFFALLTTWAAVDANTYRTRFFQARDQGEKATALHSDVQTTVDALEKRLAKTQVELAAAQASISRERELVTDLQKTVGRLGEDLAKASRVDMPGISTVPTASAVNSFAAGGTFPSAVLPMAGVPVARREKGPAPAVRAK